MATEVGAAYVRLLPSLKGFKQQASQGVAGSLQEPLQKESAKAGPKAGSGFAQSFKRGLAAAGGAAALFGGAQLIGKAFSGALEKAALPNRLKAQFGLTEAVSKNAAAVAGKLYAQNWGESLGQIGKAVGQTQRALQQLGTKEDLAKVTTFGQAFADTFEQDVNKSISSAAQLVKAGLVPNMETAFDLMTKGFQSGADSGEDLLDTVTEYAVQFQALGIKGPQAFGLINQVLAKAGRNSDLVADALKEFIIRAVDGSKATKEGFAAVGLSATKMRLEFLKGGPAANRAFTTVLNAIKKVKNPVDRNNAALALFGTKSEDLQKALLAMDPATAAAAGGFDKLEGSIQGVTDDVGGSLQSNLTSLGRTFQTTLGSAIGAVLPLISKFLEALGPITPILGPMAIAFGVVTAAVWLFNAALNANPIVRIVTLIAGLVAAVIYLWKTNEGFRNTVKAVWGVIVGVFRTAGNIIKTVFNAIAAAGRWLWNGLKAVGRGIGDVFKWIGDRVRGAKDFIVRVWNSVVAFFKRTVSAIGNAFGAVGRAILAPFKAAFNGIAGLWNNTVGRISFDIPSWIPIIGGKHFSVPKIPMLAEGGIVKATQGGILAMLGEGGQDEAVIPLDKLSSIVGASASTARAMPAPVNVYFTATGGDKAVLELIRQVVRQQGRGGNVQTALGRRRAA